MTTVCKLLASVPAASFLQSLAVATGWGVGTRLELT